MYVGVMTLLAATTSMHERPMYIGLTGLTWGLGTVLGPIIGENASLSIPALVIWEPKALYQAHARGPLTFVLLQRHVSDHSAPWIFVNELC